MLTEKVYQDSSYLQKLKAESQKIILGQIYAEHKNVLVLLTILD